MSFLIRSQNWSSFRLKGNSHSKNYKYGRVRSKEVICACSMSMLMPKYPVQCAVHCAPERVSDERNSINLCWARHGPLWATSRGCVTLPQLRLLISYLSALLCTFYYKFIYQLDKMIYIMNNISKSVSGYIQAFIVYHSI